MGNRLFKQPSNPRSFDDEDEEQRLARKPTHKVTSKTSSNLLIIGFEVFQYRGGGPPWRGYYWKEDRQIRVSMNCPWIELSKLIKEQLDPSDEFDLEIKLYTDRSREISIEEYQESSVYEAFTRDKYHLRVYRPMRRGCEDIGIFIPSSGTVSIDKASLTQGNDFSHSQLDILVSSFSASRSLTHRFDLYPPRENLSRESMDRLREYADKVYEEKMKQQRDGEQKQEGSGKSNVGADAGMDLQIHMSREEVKGFIGEAALKDLDELFGGRSEDMVLRRSDKKDHCIDFHVDYARRTLQVSLVDESEYEGGRLVYVVDDEVEEDVNEDEGAVEDRINKAMRLKLAVPRRDRGWITVHEEGVIHGVTGLVSGVRYGLLILDRGVHRDQTVQ